MAQMVNSSTRGARVQSVLFGRPLWRAAILLSQMAICTGLALLTHSSERGFRLFQGSGDEKDYLAAAENLLATGEYAVDTADPATRVHRMPGYALAYLPWRLLFEPPGAQTALIL